MSGLGFSTPLYFYMACKKINNKKELIKCLLECGANPNADINGDCLLSYAIDYDLPEIVKLLIKYGANVLTGDYIRGYPLSQAISKGNPIIIKFIQDEVNKIDSKRNSDGLQTVLLKKIFR